MSSTSTSNLSHLVRTTSVLMLAYAQDVYYWAVKKLGFSTPGARISRNSTKCSESLDSAVPAEIKTEIVRDRASTAQ